MAGLPGNSHLESLGSFAGGSKAVVSRLAHQDKITSGIVLRVGLGAVRAGLFPGKKEQAEVLVALLAKLETSVIHREYLSLRVAASAPFDDGVVRDSFPSVRQEVTLSDQFHARRNIRRYRVQVGAEHERWMPSP